MSRFANKTDQTQNNAFTSLTGGGKNHHTASLYNRGQNGYITDMVYAPNTTDYIEQPLIIKVLRGPTAFQLLEMGGAYTEALVNIMESYMQSWDGFNRTLSVSVTETEIGKSGEVFQTPTRVARARSNPTSVLVEKYGMPMMRFLDEYVRFTIMDPDVGHPLMSGISPDYLDNLADMYSMDILAYEPDPTFKFVNKAWLMTNVFPINDIGEWTGKRQLQSDREKKEYSLTWAGIQKVGYAVDALAQKFMNAATVATIDPSLAPNHIGGMTADIARVGTSALEQIKELKDSQVARP